MGRILQKRHRFKRSRALSQGVGKFLPSEKTGKSESAQAQAFAQKYPHAEFSPVPKALHWVWVGSQPRPEQITRMADWAKKNPGLELNLWVDSRHFDLYASNRDAKLAAERRIADQPGNDPSPEMQNRKKLRQLFGQLETAIKSDGGNGSGTKLSIFELNKVLSGAGFEGFRARLVGADGKLTSANAKAVLDTFNAQMKPAGIQLRQLFGQLDAAIKSDGGTGEGTEKAVSELNTVLSGTGFEGFRNKLVGADGVLTSENAKEVLDTFNAEMKPSDMQKRKNLRLLFDQLHAALKTVERDNKIQRVNPDLSPMSAISQLNTMLSGEGFEASRAKLVGADGKVTVENAAEVLNKFNAEMAAFEEASGVEDVASDAGGKSVEERLLEMDAAKLDHYVRGFDASMATSGARDVRTPEGRAQFDALQDYLRDMVPNVRLRDVADPDEITLQNKDAYNCELINRGGQLPAASDILRYEILNQHGGIYSDIDLGCNEPLDFSRIQSHPDLMLVGLPGAKGESSESTTPYFANALLAAHPGSSAVQGMIDRIGNFYDTMQGNTLDGRRYHEHINKSVIEVSGPSGLRQHIASVIGLPEADAEKLSLRIWEKDLPENQPFWQAVDSHITFPPEFVEFETEEQNDSATKQLAQ